MGRDGGMIRPHRSHPLWYAFILHRVSGLALALFLPAHFWVLSLALTDPAALGGFLAWTDFTIVKLAEFGLVFLLAVHMFGGLRLLALELLPWTSRQKTLAAGAVGISILISGTFLLQAV
jgi:fumarate reductase subunit D